MELVLEHPNDMPPLPLSPNNPGYSWGEKDLYQHKMGDGWVYFVQFNDRSAGNSYPKSDYTKKRIEACQWLNEQEIEYSWIGGRSMYEFAFRSKVDATMFKLFFG